MGRFRSNFIVHVTVLATVLATVHATVLASVLPAVASPTRADDVPALAKKLKPREFSVNGEPADAILVVHYHRPGKDYTGWNLWVWPEGGEGAQSNFGGEDAFGRYAIVPFAKGVTRAGFLIRRGNWEEKDFDQDRFVPLLKGAVAEIWVKSGEDGYTTDPKKIDTSLRVAGAFLDADDRITLAVTADLNQKQTKSIDVIDARDPARKFRTKSVKKSASIGGKQIYDILLVKPVEPKDVGHLRLAFDEKAFDGAAPATVYARDVLDGDAFCALDADFGAFCTASSTKFSTWSPVAESVELLLYDDATKPEPTRTMTLASGAGGRWETTVDGDLHGIPYCYRFLVYGAAHEAADMHGFAATSDSKRTVVVDLARLEPEGFTTTAVPTIAQITDEVIYEVHVRDYSIRDNAARPTERGTYLGLAHESPAKGARPSSGLTHFKDLGVTAVHLLPVHDFTAAVDEYNWGYWTTLFNVPESNYATDPNDPTSAIRDLRASITALHRAGIRVILDVVYNHTSNAGPDSPLGAPAPYYLFRTTRDGRLMNDSGTGNAIADERPMMRKYILDSLSFWLRTYKVDGFRFDLLGTHEPDTVRAVCERVKAIRPDATLYGEPWTGGGTTRFAKGAQKGLPIAVFNDHLRNAIRGDLDGSTIGFATGAGGDDGAIRRGIAGAIDDFTREPGETINYASAHDNLCLWDKIEKTQPTADDATRRMMQKLALGIVLTSQGVPFLHGGCDFARTKQGQHNTYNAGDEVNLFDWSRKRQYDDVFAFSAGLVKLRRAHPAFRMADDADVRRALAFVERGRTVAFTLDGQVAGDTWPRIFVAYNDEPTPLELDLPAGAWTIVVDATRAGTEALGTASPRVTLPPYSMLVAHAK